MKTLGLLETFLARETGFSDLTTSQVIITYTYTQNTEVPSSLLGNRTQQVILCIYSPPLWFGFRSFCFYQDSKSFYLLW